MADNKDWWKFYIQALEEAFIDNEQLLNELIKIRNSFVHSQGSSENIGQEFEKFLRKLSEKDMEFVWRDFKNQVEAFRENGNDSGDITHYKVNRNVSVKIEIPPDCSSVNQRSGKFLKFLLYLLPKKFREEYLGDLSEVRTILEKKGLPKWRINLITGGNFFLIVIAARGNWFQEVFQSAFKYFKELIR